MARSGLLKTPEIICMQLLVTPGKQMKCNTISSSSDEGLSALQQFFVDRQLVHETSKGPHSIDTCSDSSHDEGSTLPSAKDLTKMVKKGSLSQSRPVNRRGSFELLKETFMSSMQSLSIELDLQVLSQEFDC